MAATSFLSRGVFFLLVAAPLVEFVSGQTTPRTEAERSADELRTAVQGNENSDGLRKSRSKWPAAEAEILRATAEQDRARAAGAQELDRAVNMYETKAAMTDAPVEHYLAGRILGQVGKLNEARAHFDRAITIDPYFYWAYHGLATYYANREMHEPAAQRYRRVLELNPDYVGSRRGLALCLVNLKKLEEAELELRKILAKNPNEFETLMFLGKTLVEGGRHGDAAEFYRRATEIDASHPHAKTSLANALARSDQVDQAIEVLEKFIASEPKEYGACFELGTIHLRLGQNHKAAAAYQKGLERAPADAKGLDRGKLEERIVTLQAKPEVERIDPAERNPLDWLDILLTGRDPEQRKEAARRVGSYPWVDNKIPTTLLRALQDKDPTVKVLCLRALGKNWPTEDFEALARVVVILLRDKSEYVRGGAMRVLGEGQHPRGVAALVKALDETTPYAFRELHRSLNLLTDAYIEVDMPEVFDQAVRARLALAWGSWYEKNRDRYAKFEEETRR